MEKSEEITISRDCPAMLIPSGIEVSLAYGNKVRITHRLGGNFTVQGVFGMARIEGKNADAIGQTASEIRKSADSCETAAQISTARHTKTVESDAPDGVSENDVWAVAKTVFDPEIPVNIVDLGLIYRLEVFPANDGKRRVEVDMTLTAPGCSMGPMIAEDFKNKIESLPSVSEANIAIVWDPPWNQDMMSEEARMILGLA